MNSKFFLILGKTNIIKNKEKYLPYFFASTMTISFFYSLLALTMNEGIFSLAGADNMKFILVLGVVVIGIFSIILLFYTNSFLIKQRKSELGLYQVLGLEKKHIGKMVFWENILSSFSCIIIGIILGSIFNYLLFLILLKLINEANFFVYKIEYKAILYTSVFFLFVFFLIYLYTLIQVYKHNTIELLDASKTGEEEPKSSLFLTVLGILSLFLGYGIAIIVEDPIQSILTFFVAVLLVILGTYALFTSGSIALLKKLKSIPKIYYKRDNFISISGLLYRMKQNAAGLASISILSTMILITISGTASLYIGTEDILSSLYPKDINLSFDKEDRDEVLRIIDSIKEETNSQCTENDFLRELYIWGELKDNQLLFSHEENVSDFSHRIFINFIPLEDFNQLSENVNLSYKGKEDELIVYDPQNLLPEKGEKLYLNQDFYYIKDKLTKKTKAIYSDELTESALIFINDSIDITTLGKKFHFSEDSLRYHLAFNLKNSKENFEKEISKEGLLPSSTSLRIRSDEREVYMSVNGGFFFLGIFLSLLFTIAATLIIYYKQVSEGYDDKRRFTIFRKIGMSEEEIKKTIHEQIKVLFFLPLLTAIIHVAFAFKSITKLLSLFHLYNIKLIFLCFLLTIIIYILLYSFIYFFTAKSYYKVLQLEESNL